MFYRQESRSDYLPILFLLTGRFWGQHVAPIKVKFGREIRSSLPNFTLIGSGGGFTAHKTLKNWNFTNIIAPKGRVPCTILTKFIGFMRVVTTSTIQQRVERKDVSQHFTTCTIDVHPYKNISLPRYRVPRKTVKFVPMVPKAFCAQRKSIKPCNFQKCFGGFLQWDDTQLCTHVQIFLCAARWRHYGVSNFKPRIFRFSAHLYTYI